jgi:U3 small nucleolar RNA-associated protein 5
MSAVPKSKKSRVKPTQSQPPPTSAISQPAVTDSPNYTCQSSFSPKGNRFAFLSLAIDKHHLRIYDTLSGQSIAEHVLDTARVTSIIWSNIDLSEGRLQFEEGQPSKKKIKKRGSLAPDAKADSKIIEVVILGLSDGSLSFFSPTHGRVVRTLSHSTSATSVLSIALAESTDNSPLIWTSGADGVVHLWNVRKNDIISSWKNDDRIPYSSMAVRPGSFCEEDGHVELLAANHGIHLLSTTLPISELASFESKKPKKALTFIGHASSIPCLRWDASQIPSQRFFSMAERDRFVYVWEVPKSQSEGKIIASIPLETSCQGFALSKISQSHPPGKQTLLTLSASGKISVFPIPSELVPPVSTNKAPHKVPTLTPYSNISISSKKTSSPIQVADAIFDPEKEGSVRVARIIGGLRPVFDVVQYLNDSGGFIQDINVVHDTPELSAPTTGPPNKRYTEASSMAVRSGVELDQDREMDDLVARSLEGDLNVDLAELSLSQRLTALSGANGVPGSESGSDSGSEVPAKQKDSAKENKIEHSIVPANSLTRTLIQALHSSDSGLLETCLAHSDQGLIRNTVKRLPPQLAVPLLISCTERLGRGARVGNMKGGGGAASAQRGTGLISWIKAVLAIHSGHLMTIPDLVARLSGLHATLTTRLALQDSLLSLNGRLDLVLSQIEMRSSMAPTPLVLQKGKIGKNQTKSVKRYVEGESEDEEKMGEDVEMESEDEGSVEDVELGGDSDEGEAEDSFGEDEEDDSGDDPTLGGFIDDEAEEFDEDEDEDESE